MCQECEVMQGQSRSEAVAQILVARQTLFGKSRCAIVVAPLFEYCGKVVQREGDADLIAYLTMKCERLFLECERLLKLALVEGHLRQIKQRVGNAPLELQGLGYDQALLVVGSGP